MSTRDPALPRTSRAVLAGAVYALTLLAAVACAWGWSFVATLGDGDEFPVGRFLALALGQVGMIGGFVATVFALPRKWRTAAGLLFAGLPLAAAAGFALGGMPRTALGVALAAVVLAGLVLWHRRSRLATEELHAEIRRAGRAAEGVVTESSTHGTVNNVPRWRVVVKFVDAAGTTRWFTTHRTTFTPPSVGQPAVVRYDPARPGDTRRIVVEF